MGRTRKFKLRHYQSAVALAFLVVIPEEPALSEVEWGICCCFRLSFLFVIPYPERSRRGRNLLFSVERFTIATP
jgi:hypothetical protein